MSDRAAKYAGTKKAKQGYQSSQTTAKANVLCKVTYDGRTYTIEAEGKGRAGFSGTVIEGSPAYQLIYALTRKEVQIQVPGGLGMRALMAQALLIATGRFQPVNVDIPEEIGNWPQ